MDTISVRVLGVEEWQTYREVRLQSLQDAPDAFAAEYDTEAGFPEDLWRERMIRSRRLLAEEDGRSVGIISVSDDVDLFDGAAEAFGLWVVADRRGHGVAARLVQAASRVAVQQHKRQLITWVGTDNGRAVAFNSSYGFRPTEYRRPMLTMPVRGVHADAPNGHQARPDLGVAGGEDGEVGDVEMAMVLALGG